MGGQNIDKSLRESFKRLSRGLMQPSYPVAYQAYKDLYEIGPSAIPMLKSKLLEVDWSNSKYKELSNYISGLFSLLHDLDEDEAQIIGDRIISDGCPRHIKAILKSVFEFSLKNYTKYQIRGLDIFEHKLVKAKCDIASYLERWLNNVPEYDLEEISRLYVIKRKKINASGEQWGRLCFYALLYKTYMIFTLHATKSKNRCSGCTTSHYHQRDRKKKNISF